MQIEPQYVALIITITVHAFASVWWASKINTTIEFLNRNLKDICEKMVRCEEINYTRVEASKDFSSRDSQIDAIWKKLDRIQTI